MVFRESCRRAAAEARKLSATGFEDMRPFYGAGILKNDAGTA